MGSTPWPEEIILLLKKYVLKTAFSEMVLITYDYQPNRPQRTNISSKMTCIGQIMHYLLQAAPIP